MIIFLKFCINEINEGTYLQKTEERHKKFNLNTCTIL